MSEIVIATGWYSDGTPTNQQTSGKCYKAGWIDQWFDFHRAQLSYITENSIYVSDCKELISVFDLDEFDNISFGVMPNDKYHTRHDWWSSVLSGAMYAYNNDLHLVYIEQDCFVWGLDKAIKFAVESGKPFYYGYGDVSYSPGWAENSFTFVNAKYLPEFISIVLKNGLDKWTRPVLEIIFHEAFKEVFTPWPFGYGRKPVQDWTLPIFYKQQLTDSEIDKFMAL